MSFSTVVGSPFVAPIGFVERGNQVEVNVIPSSSIRVNVETQTESVETGVYARYAQKYLGVRATLVARKSTVITSASLSKVTEQESVAPLCCGAPIVKSQSLPIDVTSSEVLPVETAAEDAAAEIFRLRRLRRDLLSGDLGEGYFGGGLGAALDEIAREESALEEMFFGRTITSKSSHSFVVTLKSKDARYVVCRFSADKGVVDASDLSAEPLMLQITPSEQEKLTPPPTPEKAEMREFRVANEAKCELYFGTKVLTDSVFPLFEFGYTISYPVVPTKK